MPFAELLDRLVDPAHLLTHIPYALLVLSMLMNDMGWLRAIAIAAGLIRIVNRAWLQVDPVIVFWEVIFVAVNVGQLAILWYYARRHRFSEDEGRFVDKLPRDIERRKIKRLLRLARPHRAEAGEVLTREGKRPAHLIFVTEGVAQIEQGGGRIVGVCGPGDFIGEMSFITGAPASATAIAARPMRYFAFDQGALEAALAADGELRRAMDASFNRNLVGKLVKANAEAAVET